MAARRKEIDQLMSAIVLILYAVILTIKWIMVYQDVPENALKAIKIISTIIQCLVFLVVLYNALGWTGNLIIKIVFIAITAFLIITTILYWVPEIQQFYIAHNIPLIV